MSVQQEVNQLRQDVEAEIKRIWLDEPDEVKKLRMGFINSGAGSYGQYFTTFVFVDGEVRALGYLCYTTILDLLRDPKFEMDHIRKTARSMLPVCAEFLGYCGFKNIWDFTRRFLGLLDKSESKDVLSELVRSLVLYVNRMHGWVHFYFPWGMGAQNRKKTQEEIGELKSLLETL